MSTLLTSKPKVKSRFDSRDDALEGYLAKRSERSADSNRPQNADDYNYDDIVSRHRRRNNTTGAAAHPHSMSLGHSLVRPAKAKRPHFVLPQISSTPRGGMRGARGLHTDSCILRAPRMPSLLHARTLLALGRA